MIIVLDTNILVSDFWMKSTSLKLFFKHFKSIPATLIIPRVVYDEVINKYNEKLTDAFIEVKKSTEELEKLQRGRYKKREYITKKYRDSYELFLTKKLSKENIKIVDYPDICHEQIVSRIFNKKKPFDRNEGGYRDYLIWCSIKGFEKKDSGEIAIISDNYKDFSDTRESSELSEDYREDVENLGVFKRYNSVNQFNEKHIIPILEELNELKRRFEINDKSVINLKLWFKQNLKEKLERINLNPAVLGLPEDAGICDTLRVEVKNQRINSVMKLDTNEKLVNFDGDFIGDFKVLFTSDYIKTKGVSSSLFDFDYNYQNFWFPHINIPFSLGGSFILSSDDSTVSSFDINWIEGKYGYKEFN